jgi:hypothetical protein
MLGVHGATTTVVGYERRRVAANVVLSEDGPVLQPLE